MRCTCRPLDGGRENIFAYIFEELRTLGSKAIPEIPIGASATTVAAVSTVVQQDRLGVAITVRLEDLMRPNIDARLQRLFFSLGIQPSQIDLIVNLGAPNFQPYGQFSVQLLSTLRNLQSLQMHRNLVVIGTAIPGTFTSIAKGTDEILRHDWLFYKALVSVLGSAFRRPNYGDYTIVHPDFKAIDMRFVKPAGKVIYTIKNKWLVCKGGAFRENPGQMHVHCAAIVATGRFKGPTFSSGDEYIAKCAAGEERPSNQTRWKKDQRSGYSLQA